MALTHGIPLGEKRSIRDWNKSLGTSFADLFKSLGKATAHGFLAQATYNPLNAAAAFGQLGNVTANLFDAGGTLLNLKKTPENLAWRLVFQSLARALGNLVQEQQVVIKEAQLFSAYCEKPTVIAEKLDALAEKLKYAIDAQDLPLEPVYLEWPRRLPILPAVAELLAEWLHGWGLSEAHAESIANRLPAYYVFALNDELRRGRNEYEPLLQALETPATPAAERESRWQLYSAWLQQEIDRPLFNIEPFSLNQIFVELRAWRACEKETPQTQAHRRGWGHEPEYERVVTLSLTALNYWAAKNDKDDALRVISGGPGYGKSSLARMFAARQAETEARRVVFVPLHDFDPTGKLDEKLRAFARYDEYLPQDLLTEEDTDRYLLIFDGLDELAMQGQASKELAGQFARGLNDLLRHYNRRAPRLLALVCGRDPVIQSNESEFSNKQQILNLLPFHLPEESKGYADSNGLLKIDQRDAWWQKYGQASGKGYPSLPQELRRKELDDVTAYPLLNYLAALSLASGKVDFSQEPNLNEIYDDLFLNIHKRVWEKRPHPSASKLSLPEFWRVMEEIALVAWHNTGRTVTLQAIKERCAHPRLEKLLAKVTQGVTGNEAQLLMSFYFRRQGHRQTGEEAFEFTHKSFGEYLLARRLVRALGDISEERQRFQQEGKGDYDEKRALVDWLNICGLHPLDGDIFAFIRREIELQGTEKATRWQQMLCGLISFMLRHGNPLELLNPRPPFHEETIRARHAEEALLALLNACARVTKNHSVVDWPEPNTFGAWLSRLVPQRVSYGFSFTYQLFSHLALSGQKLMGRDLRQADLRNVNLSHADLSYANLRDANLSDANLSDANLSNADLRDADLINADLRDADLINADLRGADLSYADLRAANLSNADLNFANLSFANLSFANLRHADLSYANLSDARNLSWPQLDEAMMNEKTQLPPEFAVQFATYLKARGTTTDTEEDEA